MWVLSGVLGRDSFQKYTDRLFDLPFLIYHSVRDLPSVLPGWEVAVSVSSPDVLLPF